MNIITTGKEAKIIIIYVPQMAPTMPGLTQISPAWHPPAPPSAVQAAGKIKHLKYDKFKRSNINFIFLK